MPSKKKVQAKKAAARASNPPATTAKQTQENSEDPKPPATEEQTETAIVVMAEKRQDAVARSERREAMRLEHLANLQKRVPREEIRQALTADIVDAALKTALQTIVGTAILPAFRRFLISDKEPDIAQLERAVALALNCSVEDWRTKSTAFLDSLFKK